MKKKCIYTIIIVSILLPAIFLIINYKFKNLKIKHFYLGEYKVWAHRGYHKYEQENSINSFKKAIHEGAKGIELDLWYDNNMKDFVVSHEYPYRLINGKILTFNELLENISNNVYIWLDFKNSSSMSRSDAEKSGRRLREILINHNIKDKCIVESENTTNLSIFSDLGMFACYGIYIIEPTNYLKLFKYNKKLLMLKLSFIFGNISAVSIPFKQYNKNISKDLHNIPIYLYTVNDREELIKYINDNSVKIILSDNNYYNMK